MPFDRTTLTTAQKDKLEKLLVVAVNCLLASWDTLTEMETLLDGADHDVIAEDQVKDAIQTIACMCDQKYTPEPGDLDLLLDGFEKDNDA
jgi:hypothetical protein